MHCDVLLTLALILPSRGGFAPASPTPTAPPPAAASAAEAPEHLTTFDTSLVRVDWSSEGWRLLAGDVTLKEFGRRESEARLALRLIRELRLNQHGIIGAPTPSLEYWLADGQPPRGRSMGLRMTPIDAPSLRVEQTLAQWVLRDNRRDLFNFGADEDGARQALAVIHKYGFTDVGLVNPAAPSMMIFFARPEALSTADPAPARRTPATPAAEKPAPDPQSPAGKLLAQHPGVTANAPVTPAVPPLRVIGLSGAGAAAAATTPDRLAFDFRQIQLRNEGGGWKLAAGSVVVADFGTDERAARQGLAAMQYYRFTERCQIGGASGRFTCFLVGGQAPRSTMFGVDAQPFLLNRLHVHQVSGRWSICDGDQPLIEMGDNAADANRLLEMMRNQQVDRLCRIGAADGHGMTFLVRTR